MTKQRVDKAAEEVISTKEFSLLTIVFLVCPSSVLVQHQLRMPSTDKLSLQQVVRLSLVL